MFLRDNYKLSSFGFLRFFLPRLLSLIYFQYHLHPQHKYYLPATVAHLKYKSNHINTLFEIPKLLFFIMTTYIFLFWGCQTCLQNCLFPFIISASLLAVSLATIDSSLLTIVLNGIQPYCVPSHVFAFVILPSAWPFTPYSLLLNTFPLFKFTLSLLFFQTFLSLNLFVPLS